MSFSSDVPLQANQLSISFDLPPVKKEFDDALSLHLKRVSDSVNSKEGALYFLQEQATFKQYFVAGNPQSSRFVYRKVFDFVALNGGNIPAGATRSFAHGITGLSFAALIYAGCTTTQPLYFTVVYPNITMDAVNVNLTNPAAFPLTAAYAVCEYLKN